MRKIFLGILAMSSIAFANEGKIASGDITAKASLITENFNGGRFGAEFSGKANFVYDIDVEGNIHLTQSYGDDYGLSIKPDYKIYDIQGVRGSKFLGRDGLGPVVLTDSYLKLRKGLGNYGSLETVHENLRSSSFSYLTPIYKNSGIEFSGKTGYTVDYSDLKMGVGHRGDLDAKVSYEVKEGIKLSAEVGIAVSNEKYDILSTRLTVNNDKVAIIPKVALGLDYKDGKGIETGVKLSYQKEIPGLDLYFAYDVPSEKDLSLKTSLQFSNSTDFLLPKNDENTKGYFHNFSVLTGVLDLDYKINDKLSFVSNASLKNTLQVEYRHAETEKDVENGNKKETVKGLSAKLFFEPSVSAGLKYSF